MPTERHESLLAQPDSNRLEQDRAGEKRKSLSPPREVQGEAKRTEASPGEKSHQQKSCSSKKKYVYSLKDQQQKAQKDYQSLHEIYRYLRTSELPSRIKGAAAKFNFKRKVKTFTLLNDELYIKRKHQPCRVLWEHEVLPTLESCHKEWAHYPKDKGKFRVKVEERFSSPSLVTPQQLL